MRCRGRVVVDVLSRIQPQSIEMVLFDPVCGVGEKIFANRLAVRAIKIQRWTPIGGVSVREVSFGKLTEVIAIRPQVVIDHVQNYGDSQSMGSVHKCSKIIGLAVETCGSEQVDAVISPAEATRKIGDWHDFDAVDADARQFGKLACGRGPGACLGEGADMHLVDHQTWQGLAGPCGIGPGKLLRIDNLRWPVRPLRLES